MFSGIPPVFQALARGLLVGASEDERRQGARVHVRGDAGAGGGYFGHAGCKVEMLSDTSSWADANTKGDRPAKYETFAARIAQIGATPWSTDEFTLVDAAGNLVRRVRDDGQEFVRGLCRTAARVRAQIRSTISRANKSTRYAEQCH